MSFIKQVFFFKTNPEIHFKHDMATQSKIIVTDFLTKKTPTFFHSSFRDVGDAIKEEDALNVNAQTLAYIFSHKNASKIQNL